MDGTKQFSVGEISGSATAKQLTTTAGAGVPCSLIRIKADGSNVGVVYVGKSGVTKANGTSDETTGYPLAAGESQYFPVDNLNRLWIICDNPGDDIEYLAFQ